MKHIHRALVNTHGDAALLIALGVSVLTVMMTLAVYTSTSMNNRPQQTAFSEEAAFYAGEVAMIAAYEYNGLAGGTAVIPMSSPIPIPFQIINQIDTGKPRY